MMFKYTLSNEYLFVIIQNYFATKLVKLFLIRFIFLAVIKHYFIF